jgi:tellurite methyltransferase
MLSVQEQFGDIDIYLFDQLLKGRIVAGMRVVDAGCGYGRNLVYLLQNGFDVHGVDGDPAAVLAVQSMSGAVAAHFHVASVEAMPFGDGFADVVISSAVLHFAQSDQHFAAMVREMWRVLKKGGLLFCRLASSIGIEGEIQRIEGRRFLLPDGSERYLVDTALLESITRRMGGDLMDPLKTTVVQNQRAMTTWVLEKR